MLRQSAEVGCAPRATSPPGSFDKITARREARQAALGEYELAHIGINAPDSGASEAVCAEFAAAFGLPVKYGASSNFAGAGVEVMKSPYSARTGTSPSRTNNAVRAAADEAKGFKLNPTAPSIRAAA